MVALTTLWGGGAEPVRRSEGGDGGVWGGWLQSRRALGKPFSIVIIITLQLQLQGKRQQQQGRCRWGRRGFILGSLQPP